jgi:kynurenine formamidase
VDAELISEALGRQHIQVREGDAVLVRTGTMKSWPDEAAMQRSAGAGLSLAGAEWLAGHRPALVGSDTAAVEVAPSGVPGEPQPVHRRLIRELGIPLLEWVYLEELAARQVFEFLFICVPLPIRGATGSPIRPLAIR